MTRSWSVIFALVAILQVGTPGARAQVVHMPPDVAWSFADRLGWADRSAREIGSTEYWVGFSARRSTGLGTQYGRYGGVEPRLDDLLAAGGRAGAQVTTEIAVLLRMGRAGLKEVDVLSLSSGVQLDDLPLLWTGPASGADPVAWLIDLYRRDDGRRREDLLAAVAVQEDLEPVAAFLRAELRDAETQDVREAAAWWISDRLGPSAVSDLAVAVDRDPSMDVREAAVFAMSRIEGPEAQAVVLRTARNGAGDAREAARFALVRWAEERMAPGGTAGSPDDSGDVEVQKSALYALAETGAALDVMIRTARSHRNAELRRAALYWLADSEEATALDALVELSGIAR